MALNAADDMTTMDPGTILFICRDHAVTADVDQDLTASLCFHHDGIANVHEQPVACSSWLRHEHHRHDTAGHARETFK
jgi:hypothetical protein